jgi:adenylosuccinate synthase
MTVSVVVGSQWGDEAKGKIVDLLSEGAEITARFNGGDNAGHTVVNQYGTFKLRLTPNGFANPETTCVIGPGVVVNLETLINEINTIQNKGIDISGRLWISPRCHVVMPYHPMIEEIYERAKGKTKTGTTKRGMGPVHADKVSYNGIRMVDLADKDVLAEKLRIQLKVKNAIFETFDLDPLDMDAVLHEKLEQYKQIEDKVGEPFAIVQDALERGAQIVLEGAQGALLDNNWGTYPYCTASTTLAGGAAAGLGISPRWIEHVIGVAKAYTSRVGHGPMPTELLDETGETIRNEGAEFGTVTGRPRRCGWFDAELVRFTSRLNGCTEIALTKLDVLDTLPVVKICIGYHCIGAGDERKEIGFSHYWEGDARWLEECKPVYLELEGWMQSTKEEREFGALPIKAQTYIREIEALVDVPISIVSVGPGREEIIRMPPTA